MVLRRALRRIAFVALSAGVGCQRAPEYPLERPMAIVDGEGAPRDLRVEAARSPLTVITFFSAHCPCQAAHDARLVSLHSAYSPRGVAFVAVDTESSATIDGDAREAKRRGYPFPLWTSKDGTAASAFGADAATHTVVIDSHGRVRYAGGIDSDRSHLTPDAEPYLKNALDDLLAGKDVRTPRAAALGCPLSR